MLRGTKIVQEKKSAISIADSIEDYQKAADLKVRECKLLEEIHEMEERIKVYITSDDVAHVIETWTKIPVKRLTEIEAKTFEFGRTYSQRLIGQHDAVKSVSKL